MTVSHCNANLNVLVTQDEYKILVLNIIDAKQHFFQPFSLCLHILNVKTAGFSNKGALIQTFNFFFFIRQRNKSEL